MTKAYGGLRVSQSMKKMSQGNLTTAHINIHRDAFSFRLFLLMQLQIPVRTQLLVDVGSQQHLREIGLGWRQANELQYGLASLLLFFGFSYFFRLCHCFGLLAQGVKG